MTLGLAMANQMDAFIKMQIAMCEGWAKLMSDNFTAYERLFQHQVQLFQHPSYIRLQDMIPMGASWFDHYGKRAHDVDVDHV